MHIFTVWFCITVILHICFCQYNISGFPRACDRAADWVAQMTVYNAIIINMSEGIYSQYQTNAFIWY
jgi:hypothetical protein